MKDNEIGVFEAKTYMSRIIQRVLAGERFFITRRGRRVAELRPVDQDRMALERGCARNDGYFMRDDFDAPIEGMEDYT